jgi:hypothetical protein
MFSNTCEVRGKKGLLWLAREADFAVITNKKRYDLDKVNKFAVVQPEEEWVDSVYKSRRAARSRIEGLADEAEAGS